MSERKRVTVLGCGRVGAAIALDLAPDFTVTAVDRDERALAPLGGSTWRSVPRTSPTPRRCAK